MMPGCETGEVLMCIKKKWMIAVLAVSSFSTCYAQLSQEQKTTDFLALVAAYNRNYGPYQWKLQAFNYDMLKLQPWLAQLNAAHTDLEFYDVCARYVASLRDYHAYFRLPVEYEAWLPFTVDIYDGKVLIDGIDRRFLDPKTYPFQVGDELVSLDKRSPSDWIQALLPYADGGRGNPAAGARIAANMMLDRFQIVYPFAANTHYGDQSTVVIRSQGKLASYQMTWLAWGTPLGSQGPVPDPAFAPIVLNSGLEHSIRERTKAAANPWGVWTGPPGPRPAIEAYANDHLARGLDPDTPVAGNIWPFESPFPAFNPPAGFHLRLGAAQTDSFLTGYFPVGNSTVGFLRIRNFFPPDPVYALQQLQSEIQWFQQNTKGLVVDLMGNDGGGICYLYATLQYFNPAPFQVMGFSLRATQRWSNEFVVNFLQALIAGAPQPVINRYVGYIEEIEAARAQNRMTSPLPLCSDSLTFPPATDAQGHNLAYSKPILILTDAYTGSAAEHFAAVLQDAGRAAVYGVQTAGGGGSVPLSLPAFGSGPYSEGSVRVTDSLVIRSHNVISPGLPSAPYLENIGVLPDVTAPFTTEANLLSGGAPFVQGFSAAIAKLIAAGHL
jgi:hypothetical protein